MKRKMPINTCTIPEDRNVIKIEAENFIKYKEFTTEIQLM
jgi:predicted metal-binding transcription factor (methanogenesis marker protein 9)